MQHTLIRASRSGAGTEVFQFFQRVSDALHYIMRHEGFSVINYIDDFLGYGTPTVARASFDKLLDKMRHLGLDVSEKKLIQPATQAICLGILVDMIQGTVAIPQEKLDVIQTMVIQWKAKSQCTKKQLQSLLGTLLYVHKCIRPARCFLNRMQDILRRAGNQQIIKLTDEFKRDLNWFDQFLPLHNGVSIYGHKPTSEILELDACLTGLGGRWQNIVYHLPIHRGYANLGIVQLEMINILVVLRTFGSTWKGKRILVKCDNDAVVHVLNTGRTKDPYLGACARNVWLDVDLQYIHVMGKDNRAADLLSRWQNTCHNHKEPQTLIGNPVCANVS